MNSERHLLLGLLAIQNGFITQSQLLLAFGAWVSNKTQGLTEYLVEQNALSSDVVAALKRMVDLHLIRYGGDPEQSLASFSGTGSSLLTELERMAAGDLDAMHTLSHLASEKKRSKPNDESFATLDSSFDANPRRSGNSASQRFRIVREYAKGGLGIVLVAEDLQFRREVAIKQIRADRVNFEEYRSKFIQEAEITGQLEHPSIVPVYALGSDETGRPYYAMRFIRGEDLQSRIRRFHDEQKEKRILFSGSELRGLLRRFIDVCNAIAYAHDRGVLHRDLKPGNIMLGKHGETLVVDWGLAKPMPAITKTSPLTTVAVSEMPILIANSGSRSETRFGQVVGTPAYAPPEQLLGQLDKLGAVSDVYSLGAILYELLTGRAPFQGASLDELITRATSRDFPTPRMIKPEIPRSLDAICNKAMSLKPEDRYQSATLVREEVERFLNDDCVIAYPEPLFIRATRWARSHQLLVATSTVSLLMFTIGLGIYSSITSLNNARLANLRAAVANQRLIVLEAERQKEAARAQAYEAENQKQAAEVYAKEALKESALAEMSNHELRKYSQDTADSNRHAQEVIISLLSSQEPVPNVSNIDFGWQKTIDFAVEHSERLRKASLVLAEKKREDPTNPIWIQLHEILFGE